jgi:hypothetical protein
MSGSFLVFLQDFSFTFPANLPSDYRLADIIRFYKTGIAHPASFDLLRLLYMLQ